MHTFRIECEGFATHERGFYIERERESAQQMDCNLCETIKTNGI